MKEIRSHCAGVFFVEGNHDKISAQDGMVSYEPLISALKATVASDNWIKIPIRLLTWKQTIVRYLLLYLVPYVRDLEKQKKMFAEAAADASLSEYKDPMSTTVSTDNVKILAFHNTVTGCKQNLYTRGVGVSVSDLGAQNYNLCVGGHVHHAQKISPNVIYVGSPFAMTWNEANSEHRILQITIEEK
jgi:DNA repair exonuclease SbcCD nuclease subunit